MNAKVASRADAVLAGGHKSCQKPSSQRCKYTYHRRLREILQGNHCLTWLWCFVHPDLSITSPIVGPNTCVPEPLFLPPSFPARLPASTSGWASQALSRALSPTCPERPFSMCALALVLGFSRSHACPASSCLLERAHTQSLPQMGTVKVAQGADSVYMLVEIRERERERERQIQWGLCACPGDARCDVSCC